ncbi:hypothetical protein SGCZBJ_12690 [Caulobacter zeae]|uniref:ParB-like N-terminal domain-containing protein n=1 Tax=Caulobacter zeae TaxID=2055137 RepID=A0A2N5DGH7_9CAUL|nr:ParB/RepB/Spo0J family partition protein [Caulobacter zeae]PLR25086.1 hypothetical protein SGCZBJ_12690 [Caulobacter zeae]
MDIQLAFQNADVLRAIIAAGPAIQLGQLATDTGKDQSNLRRTIERMEKAGIVTREPGSLTVVADALRVIAAADVAEGKANPVRAPEGHAYRFHRQIRIGEFNPRKHFDEEALDQLMHDIVDRGLKTNLEVRADDAEPNAEGLSTNELIAGERRWRAIGRAIAQGFLPDDFPILVKVENVSDSEHALAALLENLQRVDLKPLEEAVAFDRLVNMNGWTTAQVADRVKKTQRFVQLRLSLLKLTEDQKARLDKGEMTVKDALKALANRPDPVEASAVDLLVLALIWTNANPAPEKYLSYWRKGECHMSAADQPLIASLISRGMVETEEPTKWEPKHRIGTTWKGFQALEQHATELVKADTTDARKGAMMSVDNNAYAADKAASTEAMGLNQWLGKPMLNSPIVQRLIDEKAAEDLARAEAERERQAAIAVAEAKADAAEAIANGVIDRIRKLELDEPALDRKEFGAAFNALIESLGYQGPFRLELRSPGLDRFNQPLPETYVLVDARGEMLSASGARFVAVRRLQTVALNYAMGLADVFSGHDIIRPSDEETDSEDEAEDPQNEVEFLDAIAARFRDHCGVEAALAIDLAHKAYARNFEGEECEYGDERFTWDLLDAQLIADGWAEDYPETLSATEA